MVALFCCICLLKKEKMETWNDITVKEKWQIINGTSLVFSAILLYFLAFAITLSIGFEIISAGATLLATGLAFFGITSYIKNQMIDFETRVNKKMKRLEEMEKKYEE
jgi:hypothetical protein